VLFGYDELVHTTAQVVLDAGGRIEAVVFPSARRGDCRMARVRADVEAAELRVLEQPPRRDAGPFARRLAALAPDLVLVWSYPMILPTCLLDVPRLGCLNLHMGLLPEYRGPNGLQWAIVNGETTTGVTVHYIEEGIDTGPLLARARIPIGPDEDVVGVLRRARMAGIELLRQGWPHYSLRRVPARAQDESRAGYFPRRTAEDDRIDWSTSAVQIRNLVRATAAPFPGAHTTWRDTPITVRHVELASGAHDRAPGLIVGADAAGIRVATGNGTLSVTLLEADGRPVAPAGFLAEGGAVGQRFG
jgi:methionyl-tRNA formyltransferase